MASLRILSAGAAQSVTEPLAARYAKQTGCEVSTAFGAVGAMKARVIGGEAVDVIILTAALVEELVAAGLVAGGSRRDLGTVGTGVAVRAATPLPDIGTCGALREGLLAARCIVCPDPAIATAGKVVMRALEALGIGENTLSRMRYFANGHAAMQYLATSGDPGDLGITQATEILGSKGVTYVGPLPDELQMKAVYSACVASGAQNPEAARAFVASLTGPEVKPTLMAAGFEFDD